MFNLYLPWCIELNQNIFCFIQDNLIKVIWRKDYYTGWNRSNLHIGTFINKTMLDINDRLTDNGTLEEVKLRKQERPCRRKDG